MRHRQNRLSNTRNYHHKLSEERKNNNDNNNNNLLWQTISGKEHNELLSL